ncbi:calcium-transporting ATPase 9, plasma membrane-type isoform X2 [Gossypium australe]|uniref:Calcium-transporting ATPase 9, plasma membrane-type isoform X2 n=1 Tax=Gossypium australe TaxID=47621 RepID=A0A5B6X8Y0_9ROSI|nr:calcium-transporting ATPase 9, plasma membrane-type isoform X2 [Gossypium australe]
MGSATTICSDKTGTLTLNEMTVVEAFVGKKKINPPSDSFQLPASVVSLLNEGVAQNCTGNVFVPKDGGNIEISGSPTEKAILSWAVKLGMKFDIIRSDSKILHVLPFNSEKKRGGVALQGVVASACLLLYLAGRLGKELAKPCVQADSEVRIHWKGAAEIVLTSCSGYIDSNGCLQSINEDKIDYCFMKTMCKPITKFRPFRVHAILHLGCFGFKPFLDLLTLYGQIKFGFGLVESSFRVQEFFKAAIDEMAVNSLRCVALAYRLCEKEKVPTDEEGFNGWILPEDNLVLLAIVGIKDPCRPGVKDAVKICMDAGVKVRMVTGDNIQTAKAIALECGILSSAEDATEPTIIEGRVFRELSDKEREQIAKKITVMGRSSPSDKLLLVQALRKGGDVVAVTGDGTNDAPALHEADIGLSMGIQGTEVAKESSDIIILDDNFASVVKVVRWGRSVYANIQKFVQFQLTVNVAALVINVVAAISSGDVPLNSVQLLWVNLIMDTLGALALATEPPTDNLMHRSPVGRSLLKNKSGLKRVQWGEREGLWSRLAFKRLSLLLGTSNYKHHVEELTPTGTSLQFHVLLSSFNTLFQASYQVTVLLVLNFAGLTILHLKDDHDREHAYDVKNTLIFNAFVMCQIFNEFNARKPEEINCFKGVTKNYLFMGIIGFTFVLQIIIIEFLGKFTKTVRLNWKLWLVSLGIGIISWPLAIVGKLIPVPKTPVSGYFTKAFRRCRTDRNA